jgi:hypothetical protein
MSRDGPADHLRMARLTVSSKRQMRPEGALLARNAQRLKQALTKLVAIP